VPAHSKAAKPRAQIAVIGIDIGKNVFHLIGLDKCGLIVLKAKLSRGQLENRLANLPPCLIGMEACVGSHHLSRRLIALGHDARLMPAQYVKPFLKGHKNDYRDGQGDSFRASISIAVETSSTRSSRRAKTPCDTRRFARTNSARQSPHARRDPQAATTDRLSSHPTS
jgi:transposase